jgi:uncharacterized repeat protein (TIGR01451 family)
VSEITAAGAVDTGAIAPLAMHSVGVPQSSEQAAVAALEANANVVRVERDHSRDTAAAPNDPGYPDQWALRRVGWDEVYGSVTPSSSATVAVLDTGVDASHPDLAGVVVPGTSIVAGSGDGGSDANGHGTQMAGIVAAATGNAQGVAGVGYAGVKVMPVTVLDSSGQGLDSDVISGVVYAVQHHADVILMSFSNPGYSASLQAAIDWAWSQGLVVVAATGNGASTTPTYPAGDRGVVGVSSTSFADTVSDFSNTGPDVFLAAPGEGIHTTSTGGDYTSVSGTSAAAAMVAGAAALLKATFPSASNGQLVNRLAESADPVGTPAQTGNGRLNLARAVADASTAEIEPAGAAPGGDGGPFVGPYVAASNATISGTVRDSVTNAPISGASITCSPGCGSTATNASGAYSLTVNYGGAGPITVSVQAAAPGYTPATQTSTCSGNGNGTCSPAMLNFNLSPPASASISGTVYNDANGNGALDAGESGVSGVTVSYTGASSGSVTTNGSGAYTIGSLAAGTYSVTYTIPANFVNTGTRPLSVTVAAGGTSNNNNFFAQQRNASLAGTAWNDANGNGVKDTGEVGLSGVAVSYSGGTPATSGTTTTGAGGGYSITGLPAGTYSVDYTPPTGFANTGTRPLTGIVLAAGGSATGKDFFAQTRGSISGIKWNDQDGNGAQNGSEPGLSGWTIQLCSDANCGTVLASATTGSGGAYSFTNLAPGTYVVREVQQSGWTRTFPASGSYQVTLSATTATASTGSDFGNLQVNASIDVTKEVSVDGGVTWVDANSAPGPSLLASGAAPTFRFTVANTGNVPLGGVTLTDSALDTSACSPGVPASLAVSGPGSTFTCTLAGTWAAGQQLDTATANGSFTGSSGAQFPASDTDKAYYVGAVATLSVTKKVSVDGGVTWLDADTAPGPSLLAAGGDPMVQLTLTNAGNVPLSGLSLTDDTLSTSSCSPAVPASLAASGPGSSFTCTLTGVWAAGQHVDQASASASYTDDGGNSAHPSATDTAHYFGAVAALDVTKEVSVDGGVTWLDANSAPGPSLVATGADPMFRLSGRNTGNVPLSSLSLTDDTLSTSSCSGSVPSTLAVSGPGSSFTCTLTGTWATGEQVDEATVVGSYTDDGGNVASPTDTDRAHYLGASPSLSLEKSGTLKNDVVAPSSRTDAGDKVLYTFTVTNTGNVTLTGVTVSDSFTSTNCVIPSLAPGASDSLTCSASHTLSQADVDGGSVSNTAGAAGSFTDSAGNATVPTASDTSTVTIPQVATVSLAKTGTLHPDVVGPSGRADVGDTITYDLVVTNTGNVTVHAVAVTDPLAGSVDCPTTTLVPGASVTCTATYEIDQSDIDAGRVDNTATADATGPNGQDATDAADETVQIPQVAAVSLEKTGALHVEASAPMDRANPADTILYDLVVANTGNVTVHALAVTDPLAGSVSCPTTTLAPGASVTCTATYTLTQSDIDAGRVDNTATADATGPNRQDATDTADETVQIPQVPELHLAKAGTLDETVAGPHDRVDAGDKVHYTFTVTNTGNVTLTGVSITDPLTSLDCPVGTLAPGQSDATTCTATYTLLQSDVDLGSRSNTATATGTPPHGSDTTDDDTATVDLPAAPALALVKSTSTASYAHPGDLLEYTYTLTNTGNVTLGAPFTIDDDRSTDAACPATSSLPPGETLTCTGTYAATQADIDDGSVTNTAGAGAQFMDGTITSNTDQVKVNAIQKPSVSLTKVADETTYSAVGPNLHYTYVLTNTGNVTLTSPSVSDDNTNETPAYLSGDGGLPGKLDVGESRTFHATHTVTQDDLDAGAVTNHATGSADFKAATVHSTEQTATVVATQNATLALVKDVNTSTYDAIGQTLQYSYTLKNTGNVTISSPSVDDDNSDAPPAYASGDADGNHKIDVGETWVFTAVHTVTALDILLDSVTNNATGHGTFRFHGDPTTTTIDSNTASRTVDNHSADLELTKSDSPDPVVVGEPLTYSLTVTNKGPYSASGVKINDPLPTGTTLVSASGGTCDTSVACTVADLPRNASATVTIVVTPTAAGTLTNVASASATESDPAQANNTATVTTTVNPRPTTLEYAGATTSDFHDAAQVSARLTDTAKGTPVASENVTFKLNGTETCTATTDAQGVASCSITPGETAGPYSITATFAGDSVYRTSTASSPFTVTKEETTTTYSGASGPILNGSGVTLSGVLKEDGTTPIAGRTLTLALGAQSCTGVTDVTGSASCSITVSQPLGSGTVTATFAGDDSYRASADAAATLMYASASGGNGAFVVGDLSSTGAVSFWGSQWSTVNRLSRGGAPSAFKGFAKMPGSPSCGITWSTDPGNSAPPPGGPLPSYIAVIVASSSTKSGSQITGNVVHIVVVKVNAGYDSNPGHPATGTVVATVC